ncbi:MAG TPA: hybrid sensor histidine kinase/response regulator, partial [Firmicutes bacterium]|nr:hybrid sensor histidine kinase/response regulator [Bacillota bacterium]
VMATTCRLQEALPVPMSVGKALEKIVELLSEAVPHRLLMGFLLHKRESVIECRLKVGTQGPIESAVLPLEPELSEKLEQLKSGEQLSLVEQAMLRLGDGLALGAEVTEALRSARLVILPLESGGVPLGQILLEPQPPSGRHLGEPLPGPLSPETLDLLRGYARAAALALERILLFETLEQQAEELARMARKAQSAQAQLYQSDRLASVGRLAAGAAHEINNPLAAISAQAQLLLRRVKEEKDRQSLQVILEQSTRISKIISDLMGFARPAEPKIEPTLVKGVIERALGVLEGRIKVAGVQVRKEFQADLPLISADAKQLEQVCLNLTMNALQAMKSGGTLTIRLGLEEPAGRLRIEFSDTGVGIEPKDLPSIFDPFYTTKKEGEGMGLGLAICHSIIESHRGQITASSEPGRGTTFTILLPLGGASEARRLQSDLSRQLRSVSEERRASAGSILVVDDEETLRTVLAESLSLEGFSVDLASDGTEGLDCLSRAAYDVMLLDLRMPRLEGMELLSTVRRTAPRMPVIVISGLAHERDFK